MGSFAFLHCLSSATADRQYGSKVVYDSKEFTLGLKEDSLRGSKVFWGIKFSSGYRMNFPKKTNLGWYFLHGRGEK